MTHYTFTCITIAAFSVGAMFGLALGCRVQDRTEIVNLKESASECQKESIKLLTRIAYCEQIGRVIPTIAPVEGLTEQQVKWYLKKYKKGKVIK